MSVCGSLCPYHIMSALSLCGRGGGPGERGPGRRGRLVVSGRGVRFVARSRLPHTRAARARAVSTTCGGGGPRAATLVRRDSTRTLDLTRTLGVVLSPAVYPVGITLEGTLHPRRDPAYKGPTLLRVTLTLTPLRLKDSHR